MVEAFAVAFVELQRNNEQDFEKKKYPGVPFNPLDFLENPKRYKLKKLNNGDRKSVV